MNTQGLSRDMMRFHRADAPTCASLASDGWPMPGVQSSDNSQSMDERSMKTLALL